MVCRRHVLFAILDWGMGHATRTWPLILAARAAGAQVTVASRGTAAAWLQERMKAADADGGGQGQPSWSFVEKPGTEIRYAHGRRTLPTIALQMPAFLSSIAKERAWTKDIIQRRGITHVISDNCYGAHPPKGHIPSALISHQVSPPVPTLARGVARAQVRSWAAHFSQVWIPDSGEGEMAGYLSVPPFSHPKFIGPLSRFSAMDDAPASPEESASDGPPLVGLVSGPEPQRSLMEAALLECFQRDGRPAVIFSGRPEGGERQAGAVRILHHADDHHIRRALLSASCIICRSGYTSLMDLATLRVHAVLVPTPGQPEQEYLARHWAQRWGWPHLPQAELSSFQPRNLAETPVKLPTAASQAQQLMRDWLA